MSKVSSATGYQEHFEHFVSIVNYCACNFDKKELSTDNYVRFYVILINRLFLQR